MTVSPAFLKLVEAVRENIQEMDVDAAYDYLNQHAAAMLIDVREKEEWERSHVPQAVHVCKGVIERDIEHICVDKQTPILLYCGSGFRSALAAENLQKMGYQNVISIDGGFHAWQLAELPVES